MSSLMAYLPETPDEETVEEIRQVRRLLVLSCVCIKKHVKKGNAFQLCANEHAALKALDSPFTVNLKYAFATKEELVLIMDLCMGGDLRYWLKAEGKFTDERTKYYAARTLSLIHI